MTVQVDTLRELATLCQQFRDAESAADAAEKQYKDHKASARQIAEEDIPGLMAELGLQKLVLETGETVTVGLEVYASISEERRPAAFAWLEANGFGGIIDTDVSVHFTKEQQEQAVAFATDLADQGLAPEMKQGVHASRLKSFLKERLEIEAVTEVAPAARIPLETFGARPVTLAKIKKPKATGR